jgi:hypothetical protein
MHIIITPHKFHCASIVPFTPALQSASKSAFNLDWVCERYRSRFESTLPNPHALGGLESGLDRDSVWTRLLIVCFKKNYATRLEMHGFHIWPVQLVVHKTPGSAFSKSITGFFVCCAHIFALNECNKFVSRRGEGMQLPSCLRKRRNARIEHCSGSSIGLRPLVSPSTKLVNSHKTPEVVRAKKNDKLNGHWMRPPTHLLLFSVTAAVSPSSYIARWELHALSPPSVGWYTLGCNMYICMCETYISVPGTQKVCGLGVATY